MKDVIQRFKDLNVLVIGEAMLDSYLKGYADRICREAPVPIVAIHQEQLAGGGAANTAINTATLGGNVYFCSILGADQAGSDLTFILNKYGISSHTLISDSSRKTLTKKRIIAGSQLLLRVDEGSLERIDTEIEHRLLDTIITLYPTMDAVIVSDYGYGVLTEKILAVIKKLQNSFPKVLVIDAKYPARYTDFPATLIKPNYEEVISLLGISERATGEERIAQIEKQRENLFEKIESDYVAITFDISGALVLGRNGERYRTFASPVENLKAAGAGDTYTSAFTLSLTAGGTLGQAAEIASLASSIIVKKDMTTTCYGSELINTITLSNKHIRSHSELKKIVDSYRRDGKSIVFTNGCFDILHSGHVSYLQKAKQLGDIVIVGVNADESVKKLKGEGRPVNSLKDRTRVLAGLSSIDHIIPFEEDTPIRLIKIVKPNVYVKGGDYTEKMLPEAPIVKELGGRIEIVPFVEKKSTTTIIHRIQNHHEWRLSATQ